MEAVAEKKVLVASDYAAQVQRKLEQREAVERICRIYLNGGLPASLAMFSVAAVLDVNHG